jgi:hypothetical protein
MAGYFSPPFFLSPFSRFAAKEGHEGMQDGTTWFICRMGGSSKPGAVVHIPG